MFKKIFSVFIVLTLIFSYRFALANPNINEFMYDLDGADIDWVEIYNSGDDVDVTSLKLLISNSSSNHTITKYSGSEILNNGDYGIIVPTSQIEAFVSKWGSAGNIFTSSFSLPNASGTIEINSGDKANPISSVSYDSGDGAMGDGKSLQLISGSWTASSPTIGRANQVSASDEEENQDDSDEEEVVDTSLSSNGQSKSSGAIKKVTKTSKIKAEILVTPIANVGIPISFQGKVIGTDGQPLMRGKYFWNFGDGDHREVKVIGTDKFYHTYFYPSDYTVSLEYYPNVFAESPEAVEQVMIKVVEAGVSISRVGDAKDFFVELSNDSTYDIDISKWKIVSDFKVFTIPRNTKLASKKKMIISSKLTNFSIEDKNTLKLFDSEGEVVFDYPLSLNAKNKSTESVAMSRNYNYRSTNNFQNGVQEDAIIESGAGLSASAVNSGAWNDKPYFPILASVLFIGGSASAVYFIRKRKSSSSNGDDFEILKD